MVLMEIVKTLKEATNVTVTSDIRTATKISPKHVLILTSATIPINIVKMESALMVKEIIFATATKDSQTKAAEQEEIISIQLVFQVNIM